ncbi:MAG: acyl-CoA/acyl-ACP dehydrogenase [Chloroflexi bacterium]|nr:acyl-CoA/acyl-ACP dehydrogenase [Chloroflexota bacterium]
MDFELTKEQKAIQKAAWDFANGEFTKEYALECDQNHTFPEDLFKKAAGLGLVGIHLPEEYGGQGYGLLEAVLVCEAMCRKDPGLGMAINLGAFASQIIALFGTEEQKLAYLPQVASGDLMTGAAFTEPDHGSDITDMATTAMREGGEYVINGSKTFITNGLNAGVISFLCKTDLKANPPHRGLSLIAVETNREGFEATDAGPKMGLHGSTTAELSLKNVRVPVSNLLGQENRGFYQSLEFFNGSRVEVAAQALGGAQAAFDRVVSYVKQRQQFGRRLADLQVTQHKVADMATKIEAARLITYKAAWTYDNKGPNPSLSSMAKFYAARAAVEIADEAIQMLGGNGYFTENEVERIFRDVRVTEIYEGTREIQKNTIASNILGKQ